MIKIKMDLNFIKEKKILVGLILVCLLMIVFSYKQIFNLFDTSLNNLLKNKFDSDKYWQMEIVHLPGIEKKSDDKGNTFYLLKKNVEHSSLLNISVRSGYSVKENPRITFTYFKDSPGGIILEKETGGKFREVTYTLIDYKESYSNNVFVIENDIRYNLKNIEYTIENLPEGDYRILLQEKSLEGNNPGFKIYDFIPANWSLNINKLQSLDALSFLVEPDMDTRWYYINNKLNNQPLVETLFKVYKNGKWSEEINISEYSDQLYLENKVCNTKDKFFFRTQNPVKEWIETKMIPDSVAIDEFLHSQDFRKLFVNELGDSLAIRFGLSIEPMQWSQYNYQIVYSDYYIIPSEKIYESFIEKSE